MCNDIDSFLEGEKEQQSLGVVIAEKNLFKKQMFGHISNGGGEIPISNGKSIRFIAHNENFVQLQIIEHGTGAELKTQTWRKAVIDKNKTRKTSKKKSKAISKGKTTGVEEL